MKLFTVSEFIQALELAGAKHDDLVAYIDWGAGWDYEADQPRRPRVEVLPAEPETERTGRRIAVI